MTFSYGGGGTSAVSNFNYAKTIYVGPDREFQRIYDAVASLKNQPVLGMVLIQVDDGTYTEPVLYFNDPYWSNKLTILGNLEFPSSCVINTVPDPELAYKIIPGTFIGQPDLNNQSFYGADFSKVSFGFLTDNGFILRIGGFTINGELNDASAPEDPYSEASASPNVTKAGLFASNHSKILCYDNSIVVNTALYGAAAQSRSEIFCKQLVANNCIVGVYASIRAIVVATQLQYTGYSGSFVTTDPVVSNYPNPSSSPFSNIGAAADNGGILYIQYGNITSAYQGVTSNYKGYVNCSNISFSTLSSYAYVASINSSILGSQAALTNCGLASASLGSYIEIVNLFPSGTISGNMAVSGNSFINASNNGFLINSYPNAFSGLTSNVKNSSGGSVVFNGMSQ